MALDKACRIIVREQSSIFDRDAMIAPLGNVYDRVDPDAAPPLKPVFRCCWNIRIDWRERG